MFSDQPAADVTEPHQQASGLLTVLGHLSHPRKPRGGRHYLAVVLTLATCAVLARARSYTAIGEWSAAAGQRRSLTCLASSGCNIH